MKLHRTYKTLLLLVMISCVQLSDLYAIKEGEYSIQCEYWNNGYIALGVNHDYNYDVCYVTSALDPEDEGIWEIKAKSGAYTICNKSTGQYMSFCNVYNDNCKYLELVDKYTDSSQLWTFESDGYGGYSICNVYNNSYYLNVRVNNTYLVGCFAGSFRSSNEMFTLIEQGEGGGSSFPFELTTISNNQFVNPAWYQIRIRNNKFWSANDNNIALNEVSEETAVTDDYLWAFVQNGTDGFMIYNKKYGATQCMGSTSVSDGVILRMDATGSFADQYKVFHLSDNYNGGYNIYSSSAYCAVNDYDQGNVLRFWNSYYAMYDAGSNNEFISFDPGSIVPVTSLTITSEGPLSLEIGEKQTISYTILPEDATDKRVTWTSSNESVATVQAGTVTAVKAGSATITAVAEGGEDISATIDVEVIPEITPESMSDPMLFIHFIDGRIYAFPKKYISTYQLNENTLSVECTWGNTYTYEDVQYANEDPIDLPYFTSFKFNNKFNDQLFTDVDAEIDPEGEPLNALSLNVAQIGKRLTPSFKLSDEDGEVYVGKVRQYSKKSRQRFSKPVTYIVSMNKMRMLCKYTSSGETKLAEYPYGREVTVTVTFPVLSAKQVPTVYIETYDQQEITSRDYYLDATITINGQSVFPSMEATPIQIKGRGNTSWSYSKKPYRMKFSEKVKPFGMTAGKSWVLLANAQSNSMMTNAVGHKAAALLGAAAANHIIPVDLYINGTYKGSYNFTEKTGFSNNSIDIEDESTAALLELDSYYDEDYKFRSSFYYLPINIKEPDFSEVGTDWPVTQSQLQQDYNTFEQAVSYNNDYTRYVDVDYLCRYLATNEVILNRELMHPKSVFLYSEDVTNQPATDEDDVTPWIFGPAWDLDWAYGYEGSNRYCQDNSTMDYFSNLGSSQQYWRALRYNDEKVKKQYYYVWKDFMENGGLTELLEYVDEYYLYAQPSFKKDYAVWSSGAQDYVNNAMQMKSWLKERCNYVYENQITAYPDPDPDPEPELLYGDANDDGIITVGDITALLSYLKGTTPEEFNQTLADANQDSLISVSDVVQVRNLIGDNTNATYVVSLRHHRFKIAEADAVLRAENFIASETDESIMPVELNIEDGKFSSIQFDVTVPEGMVLRDVVGEGMRTDIFETENKNNYRVILYRNDATALVVGQNTIRLVLDNNERVADNNCRVNISNALLATTEGEDFRLNACSATFGYDVTGINNNSVETNDKKNVTYDVAGRKVGEDYHGVVIVSGKKILK